MFIIAHRGLWKNACEHNTLLAFKNAFTLGFGIETDIRDCLGRLVISHGLPQGNELPLEVLLEQHQKIAPHLPLALHMNSCGLGNSLEILLQPYTNSNIFCFGNPIPDLRFCLNNLKIPNWTVYSDVCPAAPLLEQSQGIWIDYFNKNHDFQLIKSFLKTKKVCLVCEDLYNRPNECFLTLLKENGLWGHQNLMLCSNTPLEIAKQ